VIKGASLLKRPYECQYVIIFRPYIAWRNCRFCHAGSHDGHVGIVDRPNKDLKVLRCGILHWHDVHNAFQKTDK